MCLTVYSLSCPSSVFVPNSPEVSTVTTRSRAYCQPTLVPELVGFCCKMAMASAACYCAGGCHLGLASFSVVDSADSRTSTTAICTLTGCCLVVPGTGDILNVSFTVRRLPFAVGYKVHRYDHKAIVHTDNLSGSRLTFIDLCLQPVQQFIPATIRF